MIPLGPEMGSSFVGLITVGDWLTRSLKGKELFLPRYNKAFGRI